MRIADDFAEEVKVIKLIKKRLQDELSFRFNPFGKLL